MDIRVKPIFHTRDLYLRKKLAGGVRMEDCYESNR